MAREKYRNRQEGEKSNIMPHERSPLLERVPVAEPRERYPHTNVRALCKTIEGNVQLTETFRSVVSAL